MAVTRVYIEVDPYSVSGVDTLVQKSWASREHKIMSYLLLSRAKVDRVINDIFI